MRHLFVLILLVSCGKVTSGTGPDAGPSDGSAVAPGSFVWQRNLFGSFPDAVIVAGDQLYLGATVFSALDLALARVSSSGSVVWAKSFGGPGDDLHRAVAVGRNGEIAMNGEFEGQVRFGGDAFTAVGGRDAFVAKYTADGKHVWSHAAGSAGDDRGLGVAVDATGAVYDNISFHGTIDFGGGPITAPQQRLRRRAHQVRSLNDSFSAGRRAAR